MAPLVIHLRTLDGRDITAADDLSRLDRAAAARLWTVVPVLPAAGRPEAVAALLDAFADAKGDGRLPNIRGIAVGTDRVADLAVLLRHGRGAAAYVHLTGAAARGDLAAVRRRCSEHGTLVMVDSTAVDPVTLGDTGDGVARLLVRSTGGPAVSRLTTLARDGALTLCVDLGAPDPDVHAVIRRAGPEHVVGLLERPDGTPDRPPADDLPALGGWETPAPDGVAAATTRLRRAGFSEDDVEAVLGGTAERAFAGARPVAWSGP
ncbi:hypothetical protein OHA72_38155 [Dactylosporangium sp. NBC_01737]|uniref:hypothetical protein n=1 Tax=Dactylosporangium sp. NBC_01737 TaxID=2975959 RepID=UPI002E163335|nr:hypothetical protein OHA72_38155 [Dactylosporangium sp. NBC_01737]